MIPPIPVALSFLMLVAPSALADDQGKTKAQTCEAQMDARTRTEIWLRHKKRETAAAADRLGTGTDTYSRAVQRRQVAAPRRYPSWRHKGKALRKYSRDRS